MEMKNVYVFTAEQAWNGEVADTIVKAFATEEEAEAYMHAFLHDNNDESIIRFVAREGWTTEYDEPTLYSAHEEGYYATNHIECTITRCVIKEEVDEHDDLLLAIERIFGDKNKHAQGCVIVEALCKKHVKEIAEKINVYSPNILEVQKYLWELIEVFNDDELKIIINFVNK